MSWKHGPEKEKNEVYPTGAIKLDMRFFLSTEP